MNVVLATQELLEHIFAHTDKKSDAHYARVCKQWFNIAISHLWHTVDDLKKCFAILSPMTLDESGLYRFEKQPSTKDWSRFYEYATNVRVLRLMRNHGGDFFLQLREIMPGIARSRTQLYLFPNLAKLEIDLTPLFADYSALFLNREVTAVTINVSSLDHIDSMKTILDITSYRVESLSFFCFSALFRAPAGILEEQLSNLLLRQNKIRNLTLATGTIDASFITDRFPLSQLQYLQFMDCDYHSAETSTGDDERAISTLCNSAADMPDLKRLVISIHIRKLRKLLYLSLIPRHITQLLISLPSLGTTEIFKDVVEHIANSFESLVILRLSVSQFRPFLETHSTLKLDDLRALYNIRGIQKFMIHHSTPLTIAENSLEALAKAWPQLCELCLNPCPRRLTSPSIGLIALDVLTKHSTSLRDLELYLDTTSILNLMQLPPRPSNLKRLYLGHSPINDTNSVALHLSKILPPGSSIYTGRVSYLMRRKTIWPADLEKLCEIQNAWEEVDKLLTFLAVAAEDKSRRVTELEEEIEKLKERIKVLELEDIPS